MLNIIKYFEDRTGISIPLVFCSNANAKALDHVREYNIDAYILNKEDLYNSDKIINELQDKDIDLIILAGFMWMIPDNLITAFPDQMINIHPALLPQYGGKGMYGKKVHEAVIENKESETGMTIHYVNENYDEGKIIFQAKLPILDSDTPESISAKVKELEFEHYPKVIEDLLLNLN